MTDVYSPPSDTPSRGVPILLLLRACAGLVAAPVLLQLGLHPILSGGSLQTWGLYWVYTFFAVVVPGTVLAMSTIRWRADWLTWVGIGWALGHAMELVSLLLAKQVGGEPRLFLLWSPVVLAICWRRRIGWLAKVEPIEQARFTYAGLGFLFAFAGLLFFAISLPEISTAPPYISDAWFHIANANEFREHWPIQDPRLAGERFNYHVFAYAASAAVSLAVDEPIVPLLTRYSGMSCVALLVLNLFNIGRTVGRRSVAAGILGTLFVVFPFDLGTLFARQLDFGGALPMFGVYLSTTTLAGFVFLAPLTLLIRWFYQGMRLHEGWILTLFAFAGSGSKVMLGPVVLCGAAGVVGWIVLTERRIDWRNCGLVLLLAAGVLPPLLPLLFGDGSYSQSIDWVFVGLAAAMPFYNQFTIWGIPDLVARSVWLIGFDAPILIGAVVVLRLLKSDEKESEYLTFAWMSLFAAIVPALLIALHGASQLFFLYYANAIMAPLAALGWVQILKSRYVLGILGGTLLLWAGIQSFAPFTGPISEPKDAPAPFTIWRRVDWWADAVTRRDAPAPFVHPAPTMVFRKKFYLTPEVREAMAWARQNIPADGVFMVNSLDASPLGAHCECRAFYETTIFHVSSHVSRLGGEESDDYFEERRAMHDDWLAGSPGVTQRMAQAGITHLFVDHVNGVRVLGLAALGRPVFENTTFKIYAVPR